jgi:hypothetical protein
MTESRKRVAEYKERLQAKIKRSKVANVEECASENRPKFTAHSGIIVFVSLAKPRIAICF